MAEAEADVCAFSVMLNSFLVGLWRVQLRVEQNAPAFTVRMHTVYSAAVRNQGSTLIRPFEDRALQVEDVGSVVG